MENKTALTQYLDWLAELKKCDQTLSSVISLMESKATELRDTVEKEQVKVAYNQGYREGEEDAMGNPVDFTDIAEFSNAEQFYNQTYNQ